MSLHANLSNPPQLSLQLLSELESCWREQEAEIVEQLRPGLNDAEIDALVVPHGFQLPGEARLWWKWHNGAEHDDPSGRRPRQQLGPLIGHLSLDEALETYVAGRAFLEREVDTMRRISFEFDPESTWPASWLPLTAEREMLTIDTRLADRAPVHVVDYAGPLLTPVATSLGELVWLWIQAMRSGAWTYDLAERIWRNDGRRFPPELREHPYVRAWLF